MTILRACERRRWHLAMQRLGTAFNGFTIEAKDGKAGKGSDIMFDDKSWALRWLVVDTGTWMAGRQTLLRPSAMEKPDIEGHAFDINPHED